MTTASFERQYAALSTGGGIVELTGWSSIRVSGADRQAFLHNFCTNDIRRLTPGSNCEAFFTNVKGRTIGHGLIHCNDDELNFLGAPGQSSRLVEHLDRYIIRDDVQLRDTTATRNYALIAGGDVASARFAEWRGSNKLAGELTSFGWSLVANPLAVIVELPAAESNALLDFLYDAGFERVELPALNAARIEAGTPLYGIDFDESSFPQEVGRDRQAISFTKGCYLGQETVARIDALGHVNQRLVGVRFFVSRVPEAGTKLQHAGKEVGRVTSAVLSPRLNAPLALAMIRREANAIGTRLESPAGACEVISLPLESGDGSLSG